MTTYKWKQYGTKEETYTTSEPYQSYEKTGTRTAYRTVEVPYTETEIKSAGETGFKSEAAAKAMAKAYEEMHNAYCWVSKKGEGDWAYGCSWAEKVTKYKKETQPYEEDVYGYVTRYKDVVGQRTVKGSYIKDVTSDYRQAYPDNDRAGDYYYEYAGVANQAPTISGSNTSIGVVKGDFDVRYTVNDPDPNDTVKVQIMVDDRVIQYAREMPIGREQVVRIRLSDYSLGSHTITVTATDSQNASATRTYYFNKTNQAPTISGADKDLGGVYQNTTVEYIVQDADGDGVNVEIKLDGVTKVDRNAVTLGVRKTYEIPVKNLELGRHKVEIFAFDSQGASSVRTYTFQKVNTAPTISGTDKDLGTKNTGFSYKYTVRDTEGGNIKVVEKINDTIIRTLDNAPLNQELTITISDEQIRKFELNKVNTIQIEASDGMASTYRRVTFVRNNMAPIISNSDMDLGKVSDVVKYTFSATDPEKDSMTYQVFLDSMEFKSKAKLTDGQTQEIRVDGENWFKLRTGKHELKIVVSDDKGFKSQRIVKFERVIDDLIVELEGKGVKTDALAKRVYVAQTGIYLAKGAIIKYEVCNNSYDSKPSWEDATEYVKNDKAYIFNNRTLASGQAGVNIRVTIKKGASTSPSYISAIGGSFD